MNQTKILAERTIDIQLKTYYSKYKDACIEKLMSYITLEEKKESRALEIAQKRFRSFYFGNKKLLKWRD
jgi:hypothetical protein